MTATDTPSSIEDVPADGSESEQVSGSSLSVDREPSPSPRLSDLQAERDARIEAEKRAADAESRLSRLEHRGTLTPSKEAQELARVNAELLALSIETKRAEIAAARGVPLALLTGSTEEEIEATAEALLAFKRKH